MAVYQHVLTFHPDIIKCKIKAVLKGAWRATDHGISRVRHDFVTKPQQHTHISLSNSQNGVKGNAMSMVGLDFIP